MEGNGANTNDQQRTNAAENMSKLQKLAVLLLLLGPDSAAELMKHLSEQEINAVAGEMSKLGLVDYETQLSVLREFTEVALHAGTAVRGGPDSTRTVLEKAVGIFRASEFLGKVSPAGGSVTVVQKVMEMDPRQVFNLIKHEQAQTIALIVSYLNPDKASRVLSYLNADQRREVVERLATLAPTPTDVVEKVVEILIQRVSGKNPSVLNQTGGVKSAADVLNALDKNISKSLLIGMEEMNPELCQAIRQKMFTFEDMIGLDTPSMQKILREVDMRDLAVALKTASEPLKEKMLSCISRRAGETVEEEMSFMGPLKLREIEGAQARIIEVVRNLENEGELDLAEARENMRHEAVL
ncbi:MAG: flagellar motor switch protein FliG [Verrucomicrobia bacterium]|nr:flagellar motor switch protein FliG [Verrucomicrobiota bacterium]